MLKASIQNLSTKYMYPLVETIKVINGIPQNLIWHQRRYDFSVKSIFGHTSEIKLQDILKIPDQFSKGVVKARLLYNDKGFDIEFRHYILFPVRSLKIIENDAIDYSFKYTDRSIIQKMLFEKGEEDDILIVKHGRITDTSIANIVFYDGNRWFTPEFPLLKGTAREKLLSQNRIILRDISLEDLNFFTHFRLINSMLDFDDQEMIDASNIK